MRWPVRSCWSARCSVPNPILGARFYGFGNELKSGLAVAVLAAVAAALYPSVRSRRSAALLAAAGVVLAAIEGSARIGAGVGGVILVAAGFAVAALVLAPGGFSRGRVLLVLASPLVALVALAALDLATAHGSGHYTGSILHARSAGDLRDVIERRYGAAWTELKNHAMPFATAIALLYGVLAVQQARSPARAGRRGPGLDGDARRRADGRPDRHAQRGLGTGATRRRSVHARLRRHLPVGRRRASHRRDRRQSMPRARAAPRAEHAARAAQSSGIEA